MQQLSLTHKSIISTAFLLLLLGCKPLVSSSDAHTDNVVYNAADSIRVCEIVGNCDTSLSYNDLLTSIAQSFLGSRYKASTLENDSRESLTVNLQEFDCQTFVETCIALTVTAKNGTHTFDAYCSNLRDIRYRNNSANSYTERLHYLSEWITDNESNGMISDETCAISSDTFSVKINFMSKHSEAYPALKKHPEYIAVIDSVERALSSTKVFYLIPKDKIQNIEDKLHSGTIACITTNIEGLDFSHIGIIYEQDGVMRLIHASSDKHQVVISNRLCDYLAENKRQTGLVVLSITNGKYQKH